LLSRPTTEQILLDCCRELMTNVLPSLTDATAQVSVIMVETVLRNTAVRAAHEVAWMHEETADIEAYAREVAARAPGSTLETALAALAAAPRDSLHLDDVVETYCQAGNALSAALETAVASGLAPLIQRGEEILDVRTGHETDVMAGWSPTGR
jgi:rhodanese-related sulfurtransferase